MPEYLRTVFKEYYADHKENLMKHEGDVNFSRKYYYEIKPSNLIFLLKKRYEWINKFVYDKSKVLELGCGIGVTKDFIYKKCEFLSTDIYDNNWVDVVVDATKTPFEDSYYDVVFISNTIHHLPYPKKFLLEMKRIIKPGGYLLIQDVNCSFFLKLMIRVMRQEGWSYLIDVFDNNSVVMNKNDPWKGNNAIPNLLFDDEKKFEDNIGMKFISNNYEEFIIFLISGGVTAKIKTINLPERILKIIDKFDNLLVKLMPSIFALQRKVILKNEKP